MQKIIITSNDANKRIDKFLISYYTLPKSIVMKKFRLKDIRVNGIKTNNQSYLLQQGDEITTYFRGVEIKNIDIPNVIPNIAVVYEDEHVLLVNKPPGILVSGDKPNDLHSKVLSYLNEKNKIPSQTSYQPINIHRLDKNTSGIVIFSLNYESHRILSKAISDENMIEKHYVTRVVGNFPKTLYLEDNIAHNEQEQKMIINKKFGKLAKLKADRVSKDIKNQSIVNVRLITGRKHQIRAQLANAGFPIIGDPKYGGPKAALINLCAFKIKFNNLPETLKYLNDQEFNVEPPKWAKNK